jgi:shikimate dehydrogenase
MSKLRLALFGSPVHHSPSPGVHRAFGAQFGLDIEYELVESSEQQFGEQLSFFRESGGLGCNITVPLKQLAFRRADELSERAELAEAANTMWWGQEGRSHADNTDGEGLVRDLETNLGVALEGRKILLLGAGGAASGVLGALLQRHPAELVIVNRTVEKARALARRHAHLGDILCVALEDIDCCGEIDVLVEATSMGHSGEHPIVSPAFLKGTTLVYSLNYGPAARGMYALSRLAGVPFSNGLGMLVEQAARSFEIWTGHKPDTASVLSELKQSTV